MIIKRVELVAKKEFAAIALDPEHESFVVYVASLSSTPLDIHPSRRLQIADLIAKEALINVSVKYANFVDVFSLDLASKLSKHTRINNHAIEKVDS